MDKPFSVDFDEMKDYLDNVFLNDDKCKNILSESGFTEAQLQIVNALIIAALKTYDLQK